MLPSWHQRIFFHQVCYDGMASRSRGDRIRTRALGLFSNESIGFGEVRSKVNYSRAIGENGSSLPVPEKCFERVKRMEFDDTVFSWHFKFYGANRGVPARDQSTTLEHREQLRNLLLSAQSAEAHNQVR
jgi:hypothetical protein